MKRGTGVKRKNQFGWHMQKKQANFSMRMRVKLLQNVKCKDTVFCSIYWEKMKKKYQTHANREKNM